MNTICEKDSCNNITKTKQARFCSLSCANSVNKAKQGRNPPERVCALDTCDIIFTDYVKTRKFCSHSCSAKFHNDSRKNPVRYCQGCPSEVLRDTIYCSTTCRQQHEIERWLAGELDGSWKYTHAAYVRRYLDQKTNRSCEQCGFNKTRLDGSSILQVDHIDGNWQHNRPENLRLLCPNCHAMTDNWGAKNMGNGRTWKKDYNQYSSK